MKNKKQAFTMIELIFVIVIIGILAAIALPRLAATRLDAKVVNEMEEASISLSNLGMEFTAMNQFLNYTEADANSRVKCFKFTTTVDGNVTVKMINSFNLTCPKELYDAVKILASKKILTTTGGEKSYIFGGFSIK